MTVRLAIEKRKAMKAALAAVVILTGLTGGAQVSTPPAVSSPDQSSPERRLLAPIKAKMADNLARLPNYTCLQTIERSHRDARKKRFERQDLVRLEVALFGLSSCPRVTWSAGENGLRGPELSALTKPNSANSSKPACSEMAISARSLAPFF